MSVKILVIDDDQHQCRLIEVSLKKFEWDVITAQNAFEALDLLKTYQPDIIISDVMMPKMDGVSLFKKIMEQPHLKSIPFLFLSASNDTNLIEEALELGAIDYITKPYNISTLKAKIQTVLRLKKESQKSALVDEGDLKDVPIMELLQICEDNSFSGTLRLKSEDNEGTFVFEKGSIANAILVDFSQEESLDIMMQWTEGHFVLEQKKFKLDIEPVSIHEEKSVKEDKLSFYDYFELGLQSFYEQDYSEAKKQWHKALELKPDDKKLIHNLAIIEKKLNP